jgi:hypothetical protein
MKSSSDQQQHAGIYCLWRRVSTFTSLHIILHEGNSGASPYIQDSVTIIVRIDWRLHGT